MEKRDIITLTLKGKRTPYVPWSMGFTKEAGEKLQRHFGSHLTPVRNSGIMQSLSAERRSVMQASKRFFNDYFGE